MGVQVRRATLEQTIRGLRYHDWRNHRAEAFRVDHATGIAVHDDGFECDCRPDRDEKKGTITEQDGPPFEVER